MRRPPESVTTNHVQIPRMILEQHQVVTLTVDVMFVNGVPFLVSASRGLNLITAEYTPSRTAKLLADGIRRIIDLYSRGGFQVGTVLMDNEFEKLTNLVPIIQINTTAAKEHVPEIERLIRLIKEQGRGILNTLPFKKLPRLILTELIYQVVLWLNAFPLKNSGVSANLSPRELVIRHKLDFAKHCRAQFGSYYEVHDKPVPTNSMISRTTPSIVLGPTGNLQGTYKFFSLETGKKIKRRRFSPYPMPDSVIARVEQYDNDNALPGIFDFADRNGVLFEWNDDVDECPKGILEEDDVILYPSIAAELLGVDLEHDTPRPSIEVDLIPQGRAEDEATRNANHEPFGVVGVEPAVGLIIHAEDGEINSDSDEDDDNGIIAINDAPAQVAQDPLVLSDFFRQQTK